MQYVETLLSFSNPRRTPPMAKKKRQRPSTPQRPTGKSATVHQAVRELRDLYRLGLQVIKADQKDPKRTTYGKGISLRFAEELGVERDYIDKARTFASKYSQKAIRRTLLTTTAGWHATLA